MTDVSHSHRDQPPTRRERVRLELLIGALMAGPAGWILQLVVGYAVASHACRPRDAPRAVTPAGGWGGEHIGLLVLNLACLVLVVAGGMVALAAWRRSLRDPGAGAETMDARRSRVRFLAACGILVAGAFVLAILFDTAWPFFVPSCWRFT